MIPPLLHLVAPWLVAPALLLPPNGAGYDDRLDQPYVSTLPEVLTRVRPVYPEAAMKAGIEGIVMIRARVGRDGLVKGIRVARSVPKLDWAARVAVGQWLFDPARDENGQPLPVWTAIPVRFRLAGAESGGSWVDTLPRVIEGEPLPYPPDARREGIEGKVVLHVRVDPRGRARDVRVVRSVPGLDEAAEAWARETTFQPARLDGGPVSAWVAVPVRFRLHP